MHPKRPSGLPRISVTTPRNLLTNNARCRIQVTYQAIGTRISHNQTLTLNKYFPKPTLFYNSLNTRESLTSYSERNNQKCQLLSIEVTSFPHANFYHKNNCKNKIQITKKKKTKKNKNSPKRKIAQLDSSSIQ